jgi:16S rRNA (guanine527-N7)-methyltransferase
MSFREELSQLLPADLPNRERVIEGGARHLERIVEVNEVMNLTRIAGEREAAIKHILDSVLPWRHFAKAAAVLDAGTGAGFPGIPLALALPETRFLLAESIQKKARFAQGVAELLMLENVRVLPARAEEILERERVTLITARAVAPLERAIPLFARGLKQGAKALLYKGPDVEAEMDAAANIALKHQVGMKVKDRYEL